MNKRFPIRSRQRGSFTTEVLVALLLSSIAGIFAIRADLEAERFRLAGMQGEILNDVSAGAQKYLQEQFTPLQMNQSVVKNGVTLLAGTAQGNAFAPTIAQLVQMGYLTSRTTGGVSMFSNNGTLGNYQIRLFRSPTGCETQGFTTCDVTGMAWIDKPITARNSADPDITAISAMVKKLGAFGGFSTLPTTNRINFMDGTNTPNPVAGNPAGIVAVKFGYGSSGLSQFVRMNDNRDPNLQGSLTVKNGVLTELKTVGQACELGIKDNTIASSANAVVICNGGVWKVLSAQSTAGAACSPDGTVATSSVTGEQLICKGGVFLRSTSFMAKNVLVSRVLVTDGSTVTKPSCDLNGLPDRSFSLTQTSVDVTKAPPKQTMYAGTVDNGTSWTVQIRLRDDGGGEVSGNTHSITAVLNLECQY